MINWGQLKQSEKVASKNNLSSVPKTKTMKYVKIKKMVQMNSQSDLVKEGSQKESINVSNFVKLLFIGMWMRMYYGHYCELRKL